MIEPEIPFPVGWAMAYHTFSSLQKWIEIFLRTIFSIFLGMILQVDLRRHCFAWDSPKHPFTSFITGNGKVRESNFRQNVDSS
jgi:hypothetical protein